MNNYNHLLDIINKHLIDGYYDNFPPFAYSKDAATICYLLGYCSKIDYDVAKMRYEWFSKKDNFTNSYI